MLHVLSASSDCCQMPEPPARLSFDAFSISQVEGRRLINVPMSVLPGMLKDDIIDRSAYDLLVQPSHVFFPRPLPGT
jgi:hypothetical protein